MKQITINDQPVRAVLLVDGSIAAVAKDVALALGFKHTTSAVAKYCVDAVPIQDLTLAEEATHNIGNGAKMIYEDDILRLTEHSTAPYKGAVTAAVRDTLRPEEPEPVKQRDAPSSIAQLGADVIACMMEVAERFAPYNMGAIHIAAREAKRLTGLAWDDLVETPHAWCTASQLGAMFDLSSEQVNARLESLGMQVRKGLSWEPTEEYRTWSRRKEGAFCLEWDCARLELVFEAEVQ